MSNKKNLRRISVLVTAQTLGNLEKLSAISGYSIGRVIDKLTREKMLSMGKGIEGSVDYNNPYIKRYYDKWYTFNESYNYDTLFSVWYINTDISVVNLNKFYKLQYSRKLRGINLLFINSIK